jgi:hypothetical protein
MQDIHGKCRREREELQAKLAEAEERADKPAMASTGQGGMAWNAEEPGDEKVCQYWRERTSVESDWTHTMQWYGPKGSPIWIGQCLSCGWIDGQELADRIAKLRQADVDRIEQLETILTLAETWRADYDDLELLDPAAWALATAIDALVATERSAPDVPSPVAASGRTSNEDGADVGPSFEDLLADPHSQFDPNGELLDTIMSYRDAPQGTASSLPPQLPPTRLTVHARSGVGGWNVVATCTCAVAEHDGHLASQHTDCGGGHPPCGGCHQCLLRQMHHAQRTALREQWSVPCPACGMPAGKACVDAAGLLPEHLNHPARAAAHAEADSRAGQAGEEVAG